MNIAFSASILNNICIFLNLGVQRGSGAWSVGFQAWTELPDYGQWGFWDISNHPLCEHSWMWEDRKLWTDAERFGAEVRHVSLSKYLGHAVYHFGFSKPSCQQHTREEEIRWGQMSSASKNSAFSLFQQEKNLHALFFFHIVQLKICLCVWKLFPWTVGSIWIRADHPNLKEMVVFETKIFG